MEREAVDILQRVADILEEAASILDAHGLAKEFYQDAGSYCTVGAIARTVDGTENRLTMDRHGRLLNDPVYKDTLAAVADHIGGRTDSPLMNLDCITNWNDAPERTLGEVTDLLRSVAKDLRNEA